MTKSQSLTALAPLFAILAALVLDCRASADDLHILDISWTLGADHPTYRKGGSFGLVDGVLVSAGGVEFPWAEPAIVYGYTPATDSWTTLPSMPEGRAYFDGISVNNALYVTGGRKNFETQTETFRLTHNAGVWNWETLASLQLDRGYFTLGATGGKIIVPGGLRGSGQPPYSEDDTVSNVEIYDTASPQAGWQNVAPLPVHSRMAAATAGVGGKFYVFGGTCFDCFGGESTRLSDAAVFDPSAGTWSPLPNLPFGYSGGDAAVFQDRYIVLVGGVAQISDQDRPNWPALKPGYYNNIVQVFDTVTQKYRTMPTVLPYGTNDIRVEIEGNTIYAVGGENIDPATSNTVKWLQIGQLQTAPTSVRFRDGFETAPNPTPHSWIAQKNGTQPTSDSDPALTVVAPFLAQTGQWFHYVKSGTPQIDVQVTDSAAPGAAEGNNYLRIHRDGDQAAIAAAFAPWNEPLTSGIVTASFQTRFPSSNSSGFAGAIALAEFLDNDHGAGTVGTKVYLAVRDGGTIRHSFNSFGSNPDIAVPSVIEDQWQHWIIDADLDARTYTLTIDGVTGAKRPFNYPGSAVNGLLFSGVQGAEFIIDDVEVRYLDSLLAGDANGDGSVDIFDVNLVSESWGDADAPGDPGDVNRDGKVDIFDVNLISASWMPGGAASVPEPASGMLALLAVASACGLSRVVRRPQPKCAEAMSHRARRSNI